MEGEVFDQRLGAPEGDAWENEFVDAEPENFEFPEALVNPLNEIMMLGHLEDEWDFGGYTFNIRTLRMGEELRALKLNKEFEGIASAEGRSYATAMVAASLVSINGHPLVVQLAPGQDVVKLTYQKVMRWHWPVIEMVYRRYLALERKQLEVLEALHKTLADDKADDATTDSALG